MRIPTDNERWIIITDTSADSAMISFLCRQNIKRYGSHGSRWFSQVWPGLFSHDFKERLPITSFSTISVGSLPVSQSVSQSQLQTRKQLSE